MESLGTHLKTERESRNLSLREVSDATRIKERLLKAIEEDQYEMISSPVYVKGFLDAYARHLGLDPDEIILEYQKHQENQALSKGAESKKRSIPPALGQWVIYPKKKSKAWLFFITIPIAVLLIAIVMMWIHPI